MIGKKEETIDKSKEETIMKEFGEEDEIEVVETADELMREKKSDKFIASDNSAQTQIFIQNYSCDNKSDITNVLDLVNLSMGDDRKYDLRKRDECAEFFSTCKNRDYIALAIVLSVFKIVPIGDYANLKDILIEYLPAILQLDKEGKDVPVQRSNPYISLNTALSVVGGKIFIIDDGQQCIGYGDGVEEVLNNIWIQFPDLRKPIIDWLLKTNEMFEYKTSFEVYQVIGAFISVIVEDFRYAKRQVFDRLYAEPDNLGFLARLTQELLRDERFRSDILSMVIRWAESESNWLWKSAFLVCLYTYDSEIDNQLYQVMTRTIKKRMFGFRNSDLRFIVLFSGNAENLRAIVASALGELYQSCGVQRRKNLAEIYLKIIRYGYYEVNKNKTDLSFVTCDTMAQMDNIHLVLAYIMTRYDLYCQLCWVLQAYIEEISDYEVPARTLNHITAFFYVLTRDEYVYWRDILRFLSDMKGSIAKKIYNKLLKMYKSYEGEEDE